MDPSGEITPPGAEDFSADAARVDFNQDQGPAQNPEQAQAEIDEARSKLFSLNPLGENPTEDEKAAREAEINELTEKAGILGDCVWKKEDGSETPVKIAKFIGKKDDGRIYVKTDNPDNDEEVPFDQLTYPEKTPEPQEENEQAAEDLDVLRDSVGRERARGKLKIELNFDNREIFNTPELRAAARKALESNTADVRSTLIALARIRDYVSDVPAELVEVNEMYDAVYKSAQVVDSEGNVHNLADLDKEFEAADNIRKSEIAVLKKTGDYKYKFNAEAYKVPKKYEGKTDIEIVDIELAIHLKTLEAKLVELKNAGKSEEAAEVQALLAQHRFAEQSKGKLGGINKASLLLGINTQLENMGEEGLSEEVGISSRRLFESSFGDLAGHLRTRGFNDIQINAIKEYSQNGQIGEVLKIQGVADSWLAENIFGRKFNSNDELNEFMTGLMNDELRKLMLKKYGTRVGIMALFMLIAVQGMKGMFTQAAFEGGGRR